MKSELSIVIDRPIEEVFEFTNNRVEEWSKTVVEIEMLHQTPEEVGSTFRMVTEDRGHRMEFTGECTHYDAPHSSAIACEGKQFNLRARYDFESLGGSTRLTQTSEVQGKGLFKAMFVCFGWAFRKSNDRAQQAELENLKLLLETANRDSSAD